ncbi:MAG TPA: hypothetical protein PKH48_06785 [Methanofastidiosum sp.]|jgi:hypothetical protein|nr:hypothetical protein [Methanofastidiosum sp.]
MQIHIALLGRSIEHVKTAFNKFEKIDKLVLIAGKDFELSAKNLQIEFKNIWKVDVDYKLINPFTKNGAMEIIEIMKEIRNQYSKEDILINISGGTNLMACIALSGALMIGCKEVYYLLDPRFLNEGEIDIISIPLPNIAAENSN